MITSLITYSLILPTTIDVAREPIIPPTPLPPEDPVLSIYVPDPTSSPYMVPIPEPLPFVKNDPDPEPKIHCNAVVIIPDVLPPLPMPVMAYIKSLAIIWLIMCNQVSSRSLVNDFQASRNESNFCFSTSKRKSSRFLPAP